MKVIRDSAPCLLHLLLLAQLLVPSSSRPANSSSLCGLLRSMIPLVETLTNFSKKLHELSDDELLSFAAVENRLDDLPHMQHTSAHISSLEVNESLSELHAVTRSFKLHVDWLKTAKENFSLPHESAEGASTQLLLLSNLLNTSLHQEAPHSPPPSFPVVSTAFDVLQVSVEISEQLRVFCNWSKRVLRHLKRLCRCPRH